MTTQVCLVSKLSRTKPAGIGLVIVVQAHVRHKGGLGRKPFLTDTAHKGLEAGVPLLVSEQARLPLEAFLTNTAHKGSFARVQSLVNNHMFLSSKAFLADAACKGLFAGVHSLVPDQVRSVPKAPLTYTARITRVRSLVTKQLILASEAHGAVSAGIAFRSSVCSNVEEKVVLQVEQFLAKNTHEGPFFGARSLMNNRTSFLVLALLTRPAGMALPFSLRCPWTTRPTRVWAAGAAGMTLFFCRCLLCCPLGLVPTRGAFAARLERCTRVVVSVPCRV